MDNVHVYGHFISYVALCIVITNITKTIDVILNKKKIIFIKTITIICTVLIFYLCSFILWVLLGDQTGRGFSNPITPEVLYHDRFDHTRPYSITS